MCFPVEARNDGDEPRCGLSLSTETRYWAQGTIYSTPTHVSPHLTLECRAVRHEALCIGLAGYAGNG